MNVKLDDLRERKDQALDAGPERSISRQHEKGEMLARERIDYLLDGGSFNELDMLTRHRAHEAGLVERIGRRSWPGSGCSSRSVRSCRSASTATCLCRGARSGPLR